MNFSRAVPLWWDMVPFTVEMTTFAPFENKNFLINIVMQSILWLHMSTERVTVKSQLFVRYLISYFRTCEKVQNIIQDESLFFVWRPSNFNVICFEAVESTKFSSHEPVSSQKYENGYRTKICNFTIYCWTHNLSTHSLVTSVVVTFTKRPRRVCRRMPIASLERRKKKIAAHCK